MKNCDEYWDIETAFLRGRDALVVIKTGAGGTVNGYQDKYKIGRVYSSQDGKSSADRG